MSNIFNRIIKISIYLLVFLLPLFFLPFSFEAFEFNKQYLLFFLVSLAFFFWLARMVLVDKEIRFKRTPLDILVLAFLSIAILSAIFSVDKNSSIFGFYGRFSDGLIGLLSLGMLYFLITNNVSADKEQGTTNNKDKEKIINHSLFTVHSLLKVFLWSAFFVILFSYFSIFGILAKLNEILRLKFSLPLIMLPGNFNPASGSLEGLAVFLSLILVLICGLILFRAERNKLKSFINWLLLIAILVLLLLIDFVAAWIMVFSSLVLFVGIALWKRILRENVNRLLLPIFLIIVAGILLISNPVKDLGINQFSLAKEQTLGQGMSWQIGFGAAIENIKSGFLGSGLGTFHYDFAKFKPAEFNQSLLWQIRFDRAGNYIAELLGTSGFLGLLSYFALVGFFLMVSYFFLKEGKSGIPLLMVFLALVVSQFVYYQNTILAFTFWLVLGLSVVSWQKPIKEKSVSFKDFPELSLVFSALLIVLGLGFLGMYFFAAKFYLADIDYKKAVETGEVQNLEQSVSLNPNLPQYKITLARAYLSQALLETQKPEEQRDQVALSNNVYLAITYAKSGQVGGKLIKGATELAPNRVAAWETSGMIYRDIQGVATGALEWGIKSFGEAIALEPTNPVLYTELGKLYLTSNDITKAKEEFNKAKALKSDYVDASIQLALIAESENNLEEAVREMENLVTSFPFDIGASFQLGRLYFNSARLDEAILQFEKVITLMPYHSNAHYSLGLAYQKKGETENAIAEFEKVLELNPGNEDVQAKLEELRRE